jgi:hypothetical protein
VAIAASAHDGFQVVLEASPETPEAMEAEFDTVAALTESVVSELGPA